MHRAKHPSRIAKRDTRFATFLALLPLTTLLLLLSSWILFLDKKRRSLPAYLEAVRYTDTGRARKDIPIPTAERKSEKFHYILVLLQQHS